MLGVSFMPCVAEVSLGVCRLLLLSPLLISFLSSLKDPMKQPAPSFPLSKTPNQTLSLLPCWCTGAVGSWHCILLAKSRQTRRHENQTSGADSAGPLPLRRVFYIFPKCRTVCPKGVCSFPPLKILAVFLSHLNRI